MDEWHADLVLLGPQLGEGVAAAIEELSSTDAASRLSNFLREEERDPRNLLVSFTIVKKASCRDIVLCYLLGFQGQDLDFGNCSPCQIPFLLACLALGHVWQCVETFKDLIHLAHSAHFCWQAFEDFPPECVSNETLISLFETLSSYFPITSLVRSFGHV